MYASENIISEFYFEKKTQFNIITKKYILYIPKIVNTHEHTHDKYILLLNVMLVLFTLSNFMLIHY